MKGNFKRIFALLLGCGVILAGCGAESEPDRSENSRREAYTAAVSETGGAAPDFRSVRWGMSSEEVTAAEGCKPLLASEGEIIYSRITVAGKNAELRYLFDGDSRLWRGEYIFTERHCCYEDYAADFKDIAEAVSEKYGEPDLSEPCYADGRNEDIFGGFSHSGKVCRAVWETENTEICLKLYGDGNFISPVLIYTSKSYERAKGSLGEGL